MNLNFKLFKLILAILFLAGLVILLFQKDRIMNRLSDVSSKAILSQAGNYDSLMAYSDFNLEKSGSMLQGTFLEFGAINCSACRRMETVIDEIREQFGDKIAIQFFNVTKRAELETGRQFGVVAIPMQVLLNKDGRVVYKHVGYISAFELTQKIKKKIINF